MAQYLALDLGGTQLKIGIVDDKANILNKWIKDISDRKNIFNLLYETIEEHLDVDGIAISFPGVVNYKTGTTIVAGAYGTLFNDFPLAKYLEEKYHKKVAVDNDAKCAINAEIWAGALKDTNNGLIYVIGTNIGGGIAINHEVYRGSTFAAGELSYPMEILNGDLSNDNVCVKGLTTPQLLLAYKQKKNINIDITGENFFKLIDEKEKAALEVLDEFCKRTCYYIYNLQCFIDVEKVCIGGGISGQDSLLDCLNKNMDLLYERSKDLKNRPIIERCMYSNDANLIGAVKNYLDLYK